VSRFKRQLPGSFAPAADQGSDLSRAAVRLLVHGRVQGVGFRPFVFRLARQCRLAGQVRNTPRGVLIELEGDPESLVRFQDRLAVEAPEAAAIDDLTIEAMPSTGRSVFVIEASVPAAPPRIRIPHIPHDLATCAECREDIFDPGNRRRRYPFTNCTACGPRYSIVEAMPYDRAATAMRRFAMCASCQAEYHAPDDRRFHAQPNACAVCGPQVVLWDREGRSVAGSETAVTAAAALLRQGQLLAVKGLGGFQLVVRADQAETVLRLRQRKNRPSKPLAVMVPSLEAAENVAVLGPVERRLLSSSANPIVLVEKRSGSLPEAVAPRVGTAGLFLPTTPLHHLLLAELGLPVVATSGNLSEEPIVADEHEAVSRLSDIADAFLVHDRPILRRVDDSVVRVVAGRHMTFRLARGYAPLPLPALEARHCPPVLATGGHQKTALAAWTGSQSVLAQHIGDLDNPETRAAFRRVVEDLSGLYRFEPAVLACDLHPDYFTTRWAEDSNRPVRQVQHHHAHAVACMVEHDLLDQEVLALTWDGTGYGPDGTIWGGEVLRATCTGFRRVASLLPFPLPGGELAIRRPGRAAFGLLWLLRGEEAVLQDVGLCRRLGLQPREARVLAAMIRRGINSPWTSSMGRLFDAVAALVLGAHEVSYEGEAAVWLEAVADPAVADEYPLPLLPPEACEPAAGDRAIPHGDWRPMLSAILVDLASEVETRIVAARFHNALARWAAVVASHQPLREVVLSGGCFQNRVLTERTLQVLNQMNRRVYFPNQIPPGDGGLAVGQLAVAMALTEQAAGGSFR
jgi:hydrogenase maturation protein HypF